MADFQLQLLANWALLSSRSRDVQNYDGSTYLTSNSICNWAWRVPCEPDSYVVGKGRFRPLPYRDDAVFL